MRYFYLFPKILSAQLLLDHATFGWYTIDYVVPIYLVQCPLGFATLGKAAALALATSRALTDLRQYINSDLGFSNLEIWLLYSK